jgi:2-polyprenyl-3-methyl-5-hydroxy-6-metoxy-1,4-benzoquinol methylase
MDLTKKAVEIFHKLARLYEDKFMDVSIYKDSFDIFCKKINHENAVILEIACGPGNITQYLLEKRPDFRLFGIDLAPNMIELAKINNPSAEFEVMDCREILSIQKKFDGIMCGFCLPYLSKAEAIAFIENAATLLYQGGMLYLSTMEDDNSKSGFRKGSTGDEVFMNYHEAVYLTQALKENNFDPIEILRYPSIDGVTMDLVMIATKS